MTDLTPIFQAVRQAATLCHEVQQRHIVRSEKVGREPVTIADYGSQAIICRALKQHFPQDGVMSEESGKQFMSLVSAEQRAHIAQITGHVLGIEVHEAQIAEWLDHGAGKETSHLWVIDPIDGTKGFLAQRHYVIAVGILENRRSTAGIVAAPAYPGDYEGGALIHAIDGEAYIQSLRGNGTTRRIRVSERAELPTLRALESVEKSHTAHDRLARVRQMAGLSESMVERADSQEKYARIAAGDAELYLRLPRLNSTRPHSIWDHAPGTALVEAAGGKVTDVDGSPLDFSTGTTLNNHGVVASNGLIHDRVVEALQQVIHEEQAG